jgi:hypothetical protein
MMSNTRTMAGDGSDVTTTVGKLELDICVMMKMGDISAFIPDHVDME